MDRPGASKGTESLQCYQNAYGIAEAAGSAEEPDLLQGKHALMCNAAFWIGLIQPTDLLDMALLLTRHKPDFPERGQGSGSA